MEKPKPGSKGEQSVQVKVTTCHPCLPSVSRVMLVMTESRVGEIKKRACAIITKFVLRQDPLQHIWYKPGADAFLDNPAAIAQTIMPPPYNKSPPRRASAAVTAASEDSFLFQCSKQEGRTIRMMISTKLSF